MKTYGLWPVVLLVIAMIVIPIAAMWAIDTLFGTHIPLTFDTWLAMFLLLVFFGGAKYSSK